MMTVGKLPYIIIPLGGYGERFKQCDYHDLKPFVKASGKCILYWLLDSISPTKVFEIIIPYNHELAKYDFDNTVSAAYPDLNFRFLKLPETGTRGAADTILYALKSIHTDIDRQLICMDGDNFYTADVLSKINGNTILCFVDKDTNSIQSPYSHVKDDEYNNITEIVEKKRISEFACTGCYAFRSWKLVLTEVKSFISAESINKDELYTSKFIAWLMSKGESFSKVLVSKENYNCLGTPLDVMLFSMNAPNSLRICVHLDKMLLKPLNANFTSVLPNTKNINLIINAKKHGHYIIIHSTRNPSFYEKTIEQLMSYNIFFNELHLGIIDADYYIMNDSHDLEKSIGIYNANMIPPRSFNTLTCVNSNVIRKTSHNHDKLKGEIQYYKNIPTQVKHLFPLLQNYNGDNFSWYEIEYIDGIPLSTIFLGKHMTFHILDTVIFSIKQLHEIKLSKDDLPLYENYIPKMGRCLETYDYSFLDNSKQVVDELLVRLGKYEELNLARPSMIHGDPVFTNILLDASKEIKFIDMRGLLGGINTIYGDSMYDWAKIYQSLLGYEEIRESQTLPEDYWFKLVDHFEIRFCEIMGENMLPHLRNITSSLFFTLIPYHPIGKAKQYMNISLKLLGLL